MHLSPDERRLASLGLSRRARIDLLDIAEYGAEIWGPEAADRFVASFDGTFVMLSRHPDIGCPRDEFGPDVRSWTRRSYIVYYERGANIFEIRRILHAAADPILDGDG